MGNTIYVYDLFKLKLIDSGSLESLTFVYKKLNEKRIKKCLEKDYRYGSGVYFSYFPPSAFSVRDLEKKKARPMY